MGAVDEIRHLVVLMLENQSFDRLLGYLDLDDRMQKIEGVTGTETNPLSPPTDMTPVPVTCISTPMEAGDPVSPVRRQGDALFRAGARDPHHHAEDARPAAPAA